MNKSKIFSSIILFVLFSTRLVFAEEKEKDKNNNDEMVFPFSLEGNSLYNQDLIIILQNSINKY